jgi:parvulin-like peptidyl-prolyl isomerase
VKKNSPEGRASRCAGWQDGDVQGELKPDIAAAVSTLKSGEFTEPIRLQDGFQIIRVDDRKDPVTRPFSDPEVQQMVSRAATMAKADDARKKFMKQLREEAFIKITDGYGRASENSEPRRVKGYPEEWRRRGEEERRSTATPLSSSTPQLLFFTPFTPPLLRFRSSHHAP